MERLQQLDLFAPAIAASGLYDVAVTPEVATWLKEGAVAALGISGGKDSQAMAIRIAEYLDEIGHKGPRVLIHSDLGVVEWKDSLPVCERLAKRLGWELIVLRRAAPRTARHGSGVSTQGMAGTTPVCPSAGYG